MLLRITDGKVEGEEVNERTGVEGKGAGGGGDHWQKDCGELSEQERNW